MILAAALAVAGSGPERGNDLGAPGVTADPPMRVLSVDHAIRAGTMAVRLVDAAAGRAAFRVRTALRPALVRLEVRGDTGADVVRSVLVRSADGRRVAVDGLAPGSYRWLATSKVAAAVRGRLRIPEPPLAPETTVRAAGPATTAASTAPVVATAPAGDAPSPSDTPTSDSPTSGSSPPSDTPTSSPAPRRHPTGQPNDPGTRAPGPVG